MTSVSPAAVLWYRLPRLQLTSAPNLTISRLGPHKVSLDMLHVTPSTRYMGQYMCVATNSVTTTEAVHNFTGDSQ